MEYFIALAMAFGLFGTVNSIRNRKTINKGGKITETGVISPEGKDIVKKENR